MENLGKWYLVIHVPKILKKYLDIDATTNLDQDSKPNLATQRIWMTLFNEKWMKKIHCYVKGHVHVVWLMKKDGRKINFWHKLGNFSDYLSKKSSRIVQKIYVTISKYEFTCMLYVITIYSQLLWFFAYCKTNLKTNFTRKTIER